MKNQKEKSQFSKLLNRHFPGEKFLGNDIKRAGRIFKKKVLWLL